MSWESEFDSQWKIFLDIVETRIRREIDRNKKLDSEFINSIIRSEVNKWSISTHDKGAWLRNLKRKHPSLGEEFRAALEELRLSDNISFNLDLPILRFSKIVVLAWAIVLALFLVWSGYNFFVIQSSQAPEKFIQDSQVPEKVIEQKKAPEQFTQEQKKAPEQVTEEQKTPEETKVSAWKMVMRLLLGTAVVGFVVFPILSNLGAKQKKKAIDSLVGQIQKELETTDRKLRNIAETADQANYQSH